MRLAHRCRIRDDCHLFVEAGNRDREFRIAGLIYREILPASDLHIVVVRAAPYDGRKYKIVLHRKLCRAFNRRLSGSSRERHVAAVFSVFERILHGSFGKRRCHETDLMVIPFFLALAETGTLQSLIQRFHGNLIGIGAIRVFPELGIGRRISLNGVHSGSHEEPQIPLAAQCDDGGHGSIFHGQLCFDDLEHRRAAVDFDLIDSFFDLIRVFSITALRPDQGLSRSLSIRRNQ